MELEIYQIGTDLANREARCANLQQAGKKLGDEGKTEAAFNTGLLSGMTGVEELKKVYSYIQKLYGMFGLLAAKDAERMKKIAEAFDQLDSSAG